MAGRPGTGGKGGATSKNFRVNFICPGEKKGGEFLLEAGEGGKKGKV